MVLWNIKKVAKQFRIWTIRIPFGNLCFALHVAEQIPCEHFKALAVGAFKLGQPMWIIILLKKT